MPSTNVESAVEPARIRRMQGWLHEEPVVAPLASAHSFRTKEGRHRTKQGSSSGTRRRGNGGGGGQEARGGGGGQSGKGQWWGWGIRIIFLLTSLSLLFLPTAIFMFTTIARVVHNGLKRGHRGAAGEAGSEIL